VVKVSIAVAVLVAVLATGDVALAGTGAVPAPPTEPALVSRADEVRRLQAPFALPTDRGPRLELVGDSVADSFSSALAAEAGRRGVSLARSIRPGCGILRGLPTTRDGYTPPWATGCAAAVDDWRRQAAAIPADIVMFLSTWDGSPRLLDGTFVDPATFTGFRATADLMREMIDAIAPVGSGRNVVLLAESIPTHGAISGDATPERIAEARWHRAVLRDVARSDPARVRVVDLGQWLCPLGPPCPEVVDGIAARGDDGGHFSPDGAAWLAPRLLDALGVPAV
jgi:SGNH domain (fused to AT3 domains)